MNTERREISRTGVHGSRVEPGMTVGCGTGLLLRLDLLPLRAGQADLLRLHARDGVLERAADLPGLFTAAAGIGRDGLLTLGLALGREGRRSGNHRQSGGRRE